MKRIRSEKGVRVRRDKKGRYVVAVRYWANNTEHNDRLFIVEVGPDQPTRLRKARADALRRLTLVRAEIAEAKIDGVAWVHPTELQRRAQVAADAEHAQAETDRETTEQQREKLLYENVVDAWMRDHAHKFAQNYAATQLRNISAKAFAGRYWDTITKQDAKRYLSDRINGKGWFADRKPVCVSSAKKDISLLCTMGNYLRGCRLVPRDFNPFAVDDFDRLTRARNKVDRADRIIVPTIEAWDVPDDGIRRMFELAASGWTEDTKTSNGGTFPRRVRFTDHFRAFLAIQASTGSRPASEPCRLRRKDVTLPDADARKDAMGLVRYTDTKTGVPRSVPLTPFACRLVAPALDADPDKDPKAWVFKKAARKGQTGPVDHWDRNSYRKAWNTLRARLVAEGDFPEFDGWRLRWFRNVAKSRMLDAGVADALADRLQGHANKSVGRGYYMQTDAKCEAAIMLLDWTPKRTLRLVPTDAEKATA